jgi:transcriptional regulator with XRE-family HTH domain
LGVTQVLLSRWENNECWPDTEKLATLCQTLGATAGEQRGLLQRTWLGHTTLPSDKEALDAAVYQLSITPHHFEHDLYYLAFGSRYGQLARQGRLSKSEALGIWGHFGNYLAWHGRLTDAYHVAKPVFEDMKGDSRPLTSGQFSALASVTDAMASQGKVREAIEILLAFEPRIHPVNRSGWYDELSQKARTGGFVEQACYYQEKSIETAASENWQTYARLQYAERLCVYGRPKEALQQVHQCRIETNNPHAVIQHELVCAAALGLLGGVAEATATFASAQRRLQETPFPGLNAFANKLQEILPLAA